MVLFDLFFLLCTTIRLKNRVLIVLFLLLHSKYSNETSLFLSSLTCQGLSIIACNHLPFCKIFGNFVNFSPNFQIFCPFSTFLCPLFEKSHQCPYFLEYSFLVFKPLSSCFKETTKFEK